ncbi:MAG: sensor domain-containing diguanylate cyclase [Rubrivivax sp.]|nr:sensor domain-containing diguanylate cyclase [Rubrivivax sp.]
MNTRLSLRSLYTLPLVALVLVSTLAAGVLSYRSAAQVADDTVRRWLASGVRSLGQQLDSQRALVDASLRAAVIDGAPLLDDLSDDIEGLRQQLWSAVLLHPDERAELRLVTAKGQAAEVRRLTTSDAELQLQLSPAEDRTLLRFSAADGALQTDAEPSRPDDRLRTPAAPRADPREQEWVRQALASRQPLWLPTKTDASGTQLQALRLRSVRGSQGDGMAALATPVSLAGINDMLRRMPLPAGGEAVIVERDGLLVASSAGPLWRRTAHGTLQRLAVTDASLPLMSTVYPALLSKLGQHAVEAPGSETLTLRDHSPVVASWARVAEGGGRDWIILIATPRETLTRPLMNTTVHTLALGLVAGALAMLLAAWAQRRLLMDAQKLARTLHLMGEGDVETPPAPVASPELAALRDELRRTQLRLSAERHAGLANRETVRRRLHERLRAARRHNDAPLLALLFVDLDRFADINARFGEEAGDRVLQAIARRLRQTVRETDLVARWSGDEFVLLLDGVSHADSAERVRDQVERVLRDPVELEAGGDAAEPSGSVGMALAPQDAQNPDGLLQHAKADMLRRKRPSP